MSERQKVLNKIKQKKISFEGTILYSEGANSYHLRTSDNRFQSCYKYNRFALRRVFEEFEPNTRIKITVEKVSVKK